MNTIKDRQSHNSTATTPHKDSVYKVIDNSMDERIPKDSKILITPADKLTKQGELLLVHTKQHGLLLRTVFKKGNVYYLKPINKTYNTVKLGINDIQIIGKPKMVLLELN